MSRIVRRALLGAALAAPFIALEGLPVATESAAETGERTLREIKIGIWPK
jgi:hypothetical protein